MRRGGEAELQQQRLKKEYCGLQSCSQPSFACRQKVASLDVRERALRLPDQARAAAKCVSDGVHAAAASAWGAWQHRRYGAGSKAAAEAADTWHGVAEAAADEGIGTGVADGCTESSVQDPWALLRRALAPDSRAVKQACWSDPI